VKNPDCPPVSTVCWKQTKKPIIKIGQVRSQNEWRFKSESTKVFAVAQDYTDRHAAWQHHGMQHGNIMIGLLKLSTTTEVVQTTT